MAKIIKLKESDLVRMVKVILEQGSEDGGFLSIQEAIKYMEDLLNDKILPELQNELLNQYTIRVDQTAPNTYVVIIKGSKDGKPEEFSIPLEQTGNYVYAANFGGNYKIGEINTATVIDKLKEDAKVKYFLEKNPKFEQEILEGLVVATLKTDRQVGATFKLSFFGIKRGKLEGAVAAGAEYPLADFFNQNNLPMVANKEVGASLESGNMELALSKFYFSGPGIEGPRRPDMGKPSTGTTVSDRKIELKFTLVDAFKFDETNFVDEAKAMEQIDAFVNKVKNGVQKYGQELSQHIMSAEPSIVGYASVDAGPNEKITGKFGPCKSKPNRGEYNKCLSEFRAKKISEIINQKLEGTGVSLKFFGAGETTKFGPGWTKEKPTTTQETAPNRRFTLTPIPPFNKVIKGQ